METKLLDVTKIEAAKAQLAEAASLLRKGELVAFPTETVYGLGANALDQEASGRIYAAKGRPSDNPLIVHIARSETVYELALEVSARAEKLMEAFWPGPLTLIFNKKEIVPLATTGGLFTVAVRMPDHPVALALIAEANCPIAAPSANISGRPSPTRWEHVYEDLNGKIGAILQGEPCRVGIESTVLDMTGEIPTILRPGILTKERIQGVIGGKVALDPALLVHRPRDMNDRAEDVPAPRAPGMKYKHYAPKAELLILDGEPDKVAAALLSIKKEQEGAGKKVGILPSFSGDPDRTAHDFFAGLRQMDEEGMDLILTAALDDEDSVGFAVMNRMRKAAGNQIRKV